MNWLLIRGLVREQRHWGSFPADFEAAFRELHPEAKVDTIDFPGFGSERHRPSPFSIDEIVDDMRARFLKKNEISKPWNLFSISLGGMVALNWVSRYPEDFERLVLVNSSLRDLSPIHHRLKPKNYPKIASLFFEKDRRAREREILRLTSNLTREALETKADTNAEFAEHIRKRDALAQMIAAMRFKSPQGLRLPLLVLCSEQDQLVHFGCSEKIAEKFGAEIRRHKNANHDLSLDAPEWILSETKAWVSRLKTR